MKTLCVIPVRGGSKGLPRKNLAHLIDDITLLEWTILQAQGVFSYDEVVVSTEDAELRHIGHMARASVMERPAELAQDDTTTSAVVADLVAKLDPAREIFGAVAILQVTSPLRKCSDIANAMKLMTSGNFDSVVSGFEETTCHPAKLYFLEGDLAVPVAPHLETMRRQALPKAYRRNGAIFVTSMKRFLETGQLWGGRTGLVEMPRDRSVDIDVAADLETARRYVAAHASEWPRPNDIRANPEAI